MPRLKRKRNDAATAEEDVSGDEGNDYEIVAGDSLDISSALTGIVDGDNGNDGIEELIRSQQDKRKFKDAKDALKHAIKGQKHGQVVTGGGSFQSMGLHPSLLRSLIFRGYRVPTPIQRASIPSLLSSPPRDLVGMARTGSGKTLAYMIPLIQRLGGRHSTSFGTRALVLVPARELALQVLKVGKELARGWTSSGGEHAGDNDMDEQAESKKSQALKWGLIVGGESLDEQFEVITSNPDVLIATPGRLLHLAVEMNLDLKSIQYVVFDEADRLFEMGFETALQEILHRLPSSRQTLLFSATLPKSLVEFAKAGLQNPKLIRLDAESKISSDLRMAFFSVKQTEKDACLLTLLRDVIKAPLGGPKMQDVGDEEEAHDDDGAQQKQTNKGSGKERQKDHRTAPHQTLIFVATKHHVEYLLALLTEVGYAVSHIYGALDQAARTLQMDRFRRGFTSILVVTDVAARGIDIPVLENVVNYDFPHGARVFVHRVGRTARAGRKGWAWSFITHSELPHLLDLQLFLGRPISNRVPPDADEAAFTESLVLGTFEREVVDSEAESLTRLDVSNSSLPMLRDVMRKGHSMYERSIGKASQASYTRAKDMVKEGKWGLTGGAGEAANVHPVFSLFGMGMTTVPQDDVNGDGPVAGSSKAAKIEAARTALMRIVDSFRPSETVFEIGTRGKAAGALLMKGRRKTLENIAKKTPAPAVSSVLDPDPSEPAWDSRVQVSLEMADEEDLKGVFEMPSKKIRKNDYRDPEFFMSHHQKDAATDKGYSLKDGASFAEQAAHATFDLTTDEGVTGRQRHDKQVKWDRKKKKFIKGSGEGADNVKIVKTESGTRLPASYRSGRFDEWKAKNKIALPRIGEAEPERARSVGSASAGGRRFKYNSTVQGKPLDPKHIGYERKLRLLKKKGGASADDEGKSNQPRGTSSNGRPAPLKKGHRSGKAGAGSRFGGASIGKVKNELKSADQIRKARALEARKKAKNARPNKKGKW